MNLIDYTGTEIICSILLIDYKLQKSKKFLSRFAADLLKQIFSALTPLLFWTG